VVAQIKISEHPRAVESIRRAKGWGGLAGFGLIAYLSMQAGTATPDLLLRALIGGVVGYVLAWTLAVIVWRQLAPAELKAATARVAALRNERMAQLKAAADADGDQTMVIR
jgi:uncharacterized membrane protein YccC